MAGSCTFRHHSSRTFDGTRRLGLSAFVEVSPHAGQCSVLRSPALLTPFPLDNKQPFNPTQRTGSQRWKLNVKDLDVVNRERFGLFGLVVLGVNTQNFARFWEISSRFAVFFRIFFVVGRSFSQTVKSPAVFWDEACKISRRCSPREETLQSMGAGVSVMPWRSSVWGRCQRAKLIMLEHYITGARGRVVHATNYSLTCILPRDFKGLLVLFVFISWLVCFMP